jgi:hypothetical protein
MGGTQQVADKILAQIQETKPGFRVTPGSLVTGIRPLEKDSHFVQVQVKKQWLPKSYDAVFNSAPLGSMQRMDLSELGLNYGSKQAIRALGYGASCKVGIRFSNMWWIGMGINEGGIGRTDRPLRVCVYPSYNIKDKPENGGVLLCSYTWTQDAQRLGSLIKRKSPDGEDELKQLLIKDLALLHSSPHMTGAKMKMLLALLLCSGRANSPICILLLCEVTGVISSSARPQVHIMHGSLVRLRVPFAVCTNSCMHIRTIKCVGMPWNFGTKKIRA